MAVIRRKIETNFTTVPNEMLRGDLSADAIGVALYLLSHTPNWEIRRGDIKNRFGMGNSRIQRILGELESAGYLSRSQKRDDNGTFASWDYEIDSIPRVSPRSQKPHTDKPRADIGKLTKETNTNVSNKYIDFFEKLWKMHNRGSKSAALKSYKTAVKTKKQMPQEIERLLITDLEIWKRDRPDKKWWPHFSTWLNGEPWSQEREEVIKRTWKDLKDSEKERLASASRVSDKRRAEVAQEMGLIH